MNMPYLPQDCRHHSRLTDFRVPQGAVTAGSTLTLRLQLSEAMPDVFCMVCYEIGGRTYIAPLDPVSTQSGASLVEVQIALPPGKTGLLYYYFLINDKKSIYYCQGTSGESSLNPVLTGERYQVTIYDPDYETPAWMRKGILYQIFVDRFARSGERGGLDRLDYHRQLGRTAIAHEDWSEQPLYQPLPGQLHYNPCDYYGGDLAGLTEKLPYIASLGVSCLYLNPIFEADSNHKYNTSDYRKIDPVYGDGENFRALCREAAKYGIRVVLDGVFSHTGDDSVYFNRYGRYEGVGAYQSPDSPYARWYQFDSFPKTYKSWWGFESLPNVNETEPSYREFICGEDGVARHWIKEGAAGWRLDVADELPDAFIEDLRQAIKAESSDALLIGEVWEDVSNKEAYGVKRQYVMGRELDSAMNYPLRDAILRFLLHKQDAKAFIDRVSVLREHYPPPFFYACMNLISSHDVPRALSLLGGAPDKDSGMSREQQAQFALNVPARALGLIRMRLAVALQMALPGCPSVYYGDEAGVEGLMDPFCRSTFPWGKEDICLQRHVATLGKLRSATPILQTGRMILLAPHPDVVVILRFATGKEDAFGGHTANGVFIVALNRSEHRRSLTLGLEDRRFGVAFEGPDAEALPKLDGVYRDRLNHSHCRCQNSQMPMTLGPYACMILQRIED